MRDSTRPTQLHRSPCGVSRRGALRTLLQVGRTATAVLTVALAITSAVRAQWNCPDPEWQPFDPSTAAVPGADSSVFASTVWDPDGPGLIEPKVIFGGWFDAAGKAVAKNIVVYDAALDEWAPLGSGISKASGSAFVWCLLSLPSGDLLAGGDFDSAGGISANSVARWNAATGSWSALGTGMGGTSLEKSVFALAVLPSGDIIAGGDFTTANGKSANRIARWDESSGTGWSAMGSGMSGMLGQNTTPAVSAIAVLSSGDVVAGGNFVTAGGVTANGIARWNVGSSAWTNMGTGLAGTTYPAAGEFAQLASGDLIVGGSFLSIGGVPANFIARWDGAVWSALGSGMNGSVYSLSVLPTGDLVVGGGFTNAGGTPANCVARWNGSAWSALGPGIETPYGVRSLAMLPEGKLFASGDFEVAGGLPVRNIAQWDETSQSWSAVAKGFNDKVQCLATLPSGDLVAGGSFTGAGDAYAKLIARWDGQAWSALGSGIDIGADIDALAVLPTGELVAGGYFFKAGGVSVQHIARWNPTTGGWSGMGTGLSGGTVYALAVLPSGDLMAGGSFNAYSQGIARWSSDTGQWSGMGAGMGSGNFAFVHAMIVVPTGDLVVGGSFTLADGVPAKSIARWNGSIWSPLGSGVGGAVRALATLPSGDLIVGGGFSSAGGKQATNVARWDGSAWHLMSFGFNQSVYSLAVMPSGAVIAGGWFTASGGTPLDRIARWTGSGWSAMDAGLNKPVEALLTLPTGDLVAAGLFLASGNLVMPNIALWGCKPASCYADCDASGLLDIDDFICFQTLYAIGDPKADCDASGLLDIDDFICFQTIYAIGC